MQLLMVYILEDMDVNLVLVDKPNTLRHDITSTVIIKKLNNYICSDEGEWIKRECNINEKNILKNCKLT